MQGNAMGAWRDFLQQEFSHWNGGYCTWFFDKVMGVAIGDICYDHDAAYAAGTVRLKVRGDWHFFVRLMQRAGKQRGWRKYAVGGVGFGMSVAVATAGWGFWMVALLKKR